MIAILQWLDSTDDYDYLQYMSLSDRKEFLEASCNSLISHPSVVYLYTSVLIPPQNEYRSQIFESMTFENQKKYVELKKKYYSFHNLN